MLLNGYCFMGNGEAEIFAEAELLDIRTHLLVGFFLVPYLCLWLFAEVLHSVYAFTGGIGQNLEFLRGGVEEMVCQ